MENAIHFTVAIIEPPGISLWSFFFLLQRSLSSVSRAKSHCAIRICSIPQTFFPSFLSSKVFLLPHPCRSLSLALFSFFFVYFYQPVKLCCYCCLFAGCVDIDRIRVSSSTCISYQTKMLNNYRHILDEDNKRECNHKHSAEWYWSDRESVVVITWPLSHLKKRRNKQPEIGPQSVSVFFLMHLACVCVSVSPFASSRQHISGRAVCMPCGCWYHGLDCRPSTFSLTLSLSSSKKILQRFVCLPLRVAPPTLTLSPRFFRV